MQVSSAATIQEH